MVSSKSKLPNNDDTKSDTNEYAEGQVNCSADKSSEESAKNNSILMEETDGQVSNWSISEESMDTKGIRVNGALSSDVKHLSIDSSGARITGSSGKNDNPLGQSASSRRTDLRLKRPICWSFRHLSKPSLDSRVKETSRRAYVRWLKGKILYSMRENKSLRARDDHLKRCMGHLCQKITNMRNYLCTIPEIHSLIINLPSVVNVCQESLKQ